MPAQRPRSEPPPPMLVAVGPWKEAPPAGGPPLSGVLRSALPQARLKMVRDTCLLQLSAPGDLLAVLDCAGRARRAAFAVVIGDPANPEFVAIRLIERARAEPWGLAVTGFPGGRPTRQRVAAIEAFLAIQLTVLRGRRAAAWQAIDAKRLNGTAAAAAATLGIKHQSVTEQLRGASVRATDRADLVLAQLLGGWYDQDA